ncbi:hypothetical protein G6F49_008342 [Rhizopus delemar]|nr:hypothetical protein G6F49_008342 [Rhizopus delemar]
MDIVDEESDPFAVRQLVNLDSYLEKKTSDSMIQNETEQSKDIVKGVKTSRSKKYLEYTPASRELFFYHKIQHLMSVSAAARKAEVKESTARTWWKKLQEDPDSFTLKKKTDNQNRPKNRLQDEHKQSLIEFFDNEPNAYIVDAVEMLPSKFAGLEIKKSRVHEFMRDECNLSLKQTTRWPEARANENNIQNRYDWVIRWSNTDMDFSKNCIFIDEAGFDINMKPSRTWAPRGQMAVTISPTTRAPSHTIIGAISTVGVINQSIRVPKQPPKAQQLAITCDLDYKYVYLPPYSPELNPIKQFWALVKHKVRREKLKDTETLQERIADAANEVPIQHLENIIQHSKHQFENCLNHIPI